MLSRTLPEIWAEIEAGHGARSASAHDCKLGQQVIVKPDDARPTPPAFYIMGFNGGEARPEQAGGKRRKNTSAANWFGLCKRAAAAIGVDAWLIIEQCHWGSPNVAILRQRIGSEAAFRSLLRLHAEANLAYFRSMPPGIVWMTGFSALREAEEDYSLRPIGEPVARATL